MPGQMPTEEIEPSPALPAKSKVRRYLFLLVLTGLTVYFFLPRLVAIHDALRLVAAMRVTFVLLALLAQMLSYAGSGYLLKSVVNLSSNTISTAEGALITAGANSVGTLGGGVIGTAGMTYLFLRHHGVGRATAGLAGWLPIYLNNVTLSIVSLAGLVELISLRKSSSLLALGFAFVGLTLAAGISILWWILSHRDRFHAVAGSIAQFVAKVRRKRPDPVKITIVTDHLLERWDALVHGGWRGPVLGAVLNTGFDMLTLAFLFVAAGRHVTLAVLVAGYGVPQLVGKLTVILGGVGVVESGMVGLYTILGIPKTSAFVVVVAYRLISFWLPTLAGVVVVPYLERISPEAIRR
jgi:glycosyltransferase 2 family protein